MKTLLTTCLFVALYAQASYAANDATLAEPSGRDIMLKNEEARKADQNEVATLTMTLVNKAGKTRSRTAHFTFDDSEPALRKTHFKFLSPKNVRGTAFVQLEHRERENDRWLYLPALRKTRRISGSDKTDSFVGTDLSFEDFEFSDGLVGGESKSYHILREEERFGEDCWVIEALPTTEEEKQRSGYSKRIIWVSKEHYHAVFTEFYDHNDEFLKTMRLSDFQIIKLKNSEEVRPYRIDVETIKTGHRTVIEYTDFKIDQPLDGKIFTRNHLSRG
jgi:outer membrane lipoprotein-sorting protein